jgi:hypothetical protein
MKQVDYNSTTLKRQYISKAYCLVLFLIGVLTFSAHGQTTYYSIVSGNWNNGATWSTSAGGAPCYCTPADGPGNVVISSGHTVVIPNNYNATVFGDVTIKSSAILDLRATLNIGSPSNCGYGFEIEAEGKLMETGPGQGEKVNICGKKVLASNGSGMYPIPSGGILGPVSYTEAGEEHLLPVVLKSFQLKEVIGGIELTWATTMEFNNAGFEIQRSADGFLSFEVVAFVNGYGSSSAERSYSYLDTKGKSKNLYYRLRQVDLDGQFTYSAIQHISVSKIADQVVYPNPTAGPVTVDLPEVKSSASVHYSIVGADGQVRVDTKTCSGDHLDSSLSADLSNLNLGTYTILLGTSSTRRSVKLIKI